MVLIWPELTPKMVLIELTPKIGVNIACINTKMVLIWPELTPKNGVNLY